MAIWFTLTTPGKKRCCDILKGLRKLLLLLPSLLVCIAIGESAFSINGLRLVECSVLTARPIQPSQGTLSWLTSLTGTIAVRLGPIVLGGPSERV